MTSGQGLKETSRRNFTSASVFTEGQGSAVLLLITAQYFKQLVLVGPFAFGRDEGCMLQVSFGVDFKAFPINIA